MTPQINDRIEMVLMGPDPCPIAPGDKGVVTSVSDLSKLGRGYAGQTQVSVRWDSGRTLALCLPEDKIKILKEEKHAAV